MDTLLWADYVGRVHVLLPDTNAPFCLACQDEVRETTLVLAAFLNYFQHLSSAEENQNSGLSLCTWHAWWVFNQCMRDSALIAQVEPVLYDREARLLQHVQLSDRETTCHLCLWIHEQEESRLERLQTQEHDMQHALQLCLWHTRIALRSALNEEDVQRLGRALFHSGFPLSKRLEAYIQKCSQHLQNQMQPDELTVWFNAVRWFIGDENTQFLRAHKPKSLLLR
jgi:hypothetical protein